MFARLAGAFLVHKNLCQAQPDAVPTRIDGKRLLVIQACGREVLKMVRDPAAPQEGLQVIGPALEPKIQQRQRFGKSLVPHVIIRQDFKNIEGVGAVLLQALV